MDYKGYRIEGDKTYGMFLIKTSVGSLPDILKGSFTRTREATYAIDQYEIIKQEREDKPAPIKKVKLTPRELSPSEVVDDSTEDDSGD